MITTYHGDALAAKTGLIVHGCNCQGVMGAGIALQVKNRYPQAYKVYRDQHESIRQSIGGPFAGLELGQITWAKAHDGAHKYIVNANTQFNCGGDKRYVDYEAVANCFEKVTDLAIKLSQDAGVMLPIIFPAIGAGLAGGNWKIISTIIDETVPVEFEKHLYLFP